MRIIVIKLPACISRFLLRLRGEYERSNTYRPRRIGFTETTAGGDRKWNCQ